MQWTNSLTSQSNSLTSHSNSLTSQSNSLTSQSNSLTSQSVEPVDDVSPRLQVCIGKLVELGPPLRNVGPPLLQDGVRPGEHEEGLGLADDVALRQLLGAPGVQSPLEVLFKARWSLEGSKDTEKDLIRPLHEN